MNTNTQTHSCLFFYQAINKAIKIISLHVFNIFGVIMRSVCVCVCVCDREREKEREIILPENPHSILQHYLVTFPFGIKNCC